MRKAVTSIFNKLQHQNGNTGKSHRPIGCGNLETFWGVYLSWLKILTSAPPEGTSTCSKLRRLGSNFLHWKPSKILFHCTQLKLTCKHCPPPALRSYIKIHSGVPAVVQRGLRIGLQGCRFAAAAWFQSQALLWAVSVAIIYILYIHTYTHTSSIFIKPRLLRQSPFTAIFSGLPSEKCLIITTI